MERHDPGADAQLDALTLVPRARLGEEQVVGERIRAEEELLAQRRPVVRWQRLLADEEDAAVEAAPSQPARGARGGHAAADDQQVGVLRLRHRPESSASSCLVRMGGIRRGAIR